MNKALLVKTVTSRIFLGCTIFLMACGISTVAFGQKRTLRIVSYNIDCADQSSDNNITGPTHSLPTVVQAIGLHHIGSNVQPVDVMTVEELSSTTLANFVAQLNVIYGAGTYAFDPTSDPNTGGGPDGLIYRTNTVQVVSARALPTGQTVLLQSNGTYTAAHSPGGGVNGVTRGPMVYQLRPVGFGTNDDFYIYVSHARSTSDDSAGDARYAEAQEVRSDAKYKLPAGAHILYAGDWNLFNGSGENAYKCLTGQTTSDGIDWSDGSAIWANANQTQGYDPMSKTTPATTVTWANVGGDNASYLYGDSTASLDSRIDIQLPNALMFSAYNSQGGVQLAPDKSDPFDTSNFPSAQYPYAFETFGNNGSAGGGPATSPANHSLDDLTNTVPSAATVYADLQLTGSGSSSTGSDHYPIVGDYNVVPTPQTIQTVFIIVEENQNWASISGNAACPYINNGLLPKSSYALQYYNPPGLHPSLPNYLWLEAGTNFGILADGDALTFHESTTNHLVTLLKNAGISWTSFQEGIGGTTCPLTDSGQYAAKHNPMVHFDDVTNTNNTGSTYCISNVRPFTELAGDLQSNVVTRYNFIAPNLCDDMHGNTGCLTGNALLTAGDTWLSNTVATIVSSQAYSNNGVIFITWDEGEGGDGPIGMIVLSPLAKGGGYSNSIHYTHSSTLLMMQEIFNVGPLLGNAANATDLSDLFVFGAQLAISPSSGLTSSGTIGGPFSPGSQSYTLSNTGNVAMVWSATNTVNWLTLSATNGTLAAGGTTNITVSINGNANSLSGGSYSDTVVFATSNGSGKVTQPVSLTVNNPSGQLSVSPSSPFATGGPTGGPFTPINQTYTLSNIGAVSMNWTANNSANWLTLSITSGTLASGGSTNVTASINANANSLASGGYSDTIGFTNTSSGAGNTTRAVTLNIGNFGFYDDFSTFSSGSLVGQQGWTQLGAIANSPVQVTGGQAGFTGGLIVNSQTAYKSFKLTNETVFYGLTLTLTNAPNSTGVPYFAALYTGTNGTGTAGFRLAAESPDSANTNYVLGVRITPAAGDPYTFGTTGLNYGTQYRVIVQAVAGGTNVILYVNPTSGNLGAQTRYATNTVTTGLSSVGSVAISQLDSGTIASDGGLIGKVAVGDNFGTVYNELLGPLPPVASFTGNPTSGLVPLTVTFTDTSSGSVTNWSWSFGDGGTTNVTTNSVLYTYNVAGVYSVSETVNGLGGSSTVTNVNYITALAPVIASFAGTPTNGVVPLTVTFTDTSSGSVTNWFWNFGDGGTTNVTTNSVLYTYNVAGVYSVSETVNGPGGSSTVTNVNYITALTPPPVASFAATPLSGAAPLNVSFTDTSSGSITGWAWAFGDGNTSTSQNPSDIYANPGSYTVQEIVSGLGGSSTDTMANLVSVYDPFAWWQIQYFGSTNNPNAIPNEDVTGSGMSNTNKFLLGFNPTNSAAYLHVISIVEQVLAGNTTVVVTYLGPNGDNTYTPGIASRTNVLDYMTGDAVGNYTNGGWQSTGQTNILSGGNGSGIVTNMVDAAIPGISTNRFYRVRVLLP